MWVLEARKDAEKIWYPVVWETTKDADNIIDYDIREEQTKDISAEINANNQTTTGMATVIPWVNAPKLIESTSIISNPIPWYVYASVAFQWASIWDWWHEVLGVQGIAWQIWEPNFIKVWTNRLKFPRDWVYKLYIVYPAGSSSRYYYKYRVNTNLQWQIAYKSGSTTYQYDEEKTLEFKKWELLYCDASVISVDPDWTGTVSPVMYINLTRLW
jgi:hypothetical protein